MKLKDMVVGATGYTLPWAVWLDLKEQYVINLEFPVLSQPSGTCNMWVERTGKDTFTARHSEPENIHQMRLPGIYTDAGHIDIVTQRQDWDRAAVVLVT